MDVFEITGYKTGVDDAGVNYLSPADSFQEIIDGFIYRQVLQSRQGFGYFAPRLANNTRILGIFEFIKPNGDRELLAVDRNFLYKYNTATDVFDQVAFGGSLAGYAGFAVNSDSPEAYISGVGYPTFDNQARFVICGKGITAAASGSAIFFYNGTDVRDYTSVVDNVKYAAPVEGALQRATYVLYFNERLNFIVPTVVSQRNQGVLFSGIRNLAGNGDKFNVAGAGLIQFSTYEAIKGVAILGQQMTVQFDDSNRGLEITTDAFNPYRIINIPSVTGTSAPFSSISWANAVTSIGKAGIIQQDGREVLRIDNKIPHFTLNEIDQVDFELIYGGFDRINGQFLWSYKKEDETANETQDHVLVRNYEEETWSIFKQRFTVFGQSLIGQNKTWDEIEAASGDVSWDRWDTTEESWNKIGLGQDVLKVLAGDNLGFIYELNSDFDDYITSIKSITKESNAVLMVAASAFIAGDKVIVQSAEGMTQINNFFPATNQTDIEEYTVVSSTATSVTLNVDSTLFTTHTANTGRLSKAINFRAKTIPLNPYRQHGRRFNVSHVEFLIDCNGGFLKVDVLDDTSDIPFLENVIVQPTGKIGREWVTMAVNHEANFITFIFKQLSPAVQFKGTSIRIHASPGGFTSE